MGETIYEDELAADAVVFVRFVTQRGVVTSYSVVLMTVEGEGLRAVCVYDNAHGVHDMHRYTREGVKQAAEAFHRGSAGEAMRSAIEAVRGGFREMIDSWRR
jgi:hypothetical protein